MFQDYPMSLKNADTNMTSVSSKSTLISSVHIVLDKKGLNMLMTICVQIPTNLQGGLRQYCIEIKSHAIDVYQISDVDLTLEPIRQEDNCK